MSGHHTICLLRSKVVIVGDAAVGKSAITQMFHSSGQTFPKRYVMTIGVDFSVKVVNIPNCSKAVELYLFDTAGQSIFSEQDLANKHWETANQVVVVYDVSKPESFQSCSKWLAKIRQVRQGRPIPGVLVANKIDLEARRLGGGVTREDGQQFAAANGLCYFECSALNSGLGTDASGLSNVDMPFYFLADEFRKRYEEAVLCSDNMRV